MPVLACSEVQGLAELLSAKANAADIAGLVTTALATANVASLADITWANVANKPTTFTPATHVHTVADVTGLQTALDGKQASGSYALTSHNHSGVYAPVSHTHVIGDVTGLQAALDGKQASGTYLTVFGNTTGNGGTVTQATSKATAVTLNKATGEITLNAAALAAGAIVTFVMNNSVLAAGDMIVTSHHSGGTIGPYLINARVTGAGAASIAVRNTSAASLSEAIVIKFTVIKAVTA